MAVVVTGLSFATLELDGRLAGGLGDVGWLYSGSPAGARSVLQTIATSMIGVAGVVFSITTVTLTLAARQFGPRVFRNFMRDTTTQVVLGTFTSTFLYCLLILRQVHGSDGEISQFVPQVSMLVAVVFAVASLVVLIYFIHHVAARIQVPNVLAAVARDLLASVRALYPEEIGKDPTPADDDALRDQVPDRFEREAVAVRADSGGYVRRIEAGALLRVAKDRDLVVRVERRPGTFAATGDPVLLAWPADRVTDEVRGELRGAVALGDQRTPNQDVTFPVGQLVEVATLALSPGVNNLTTAQMSIDRLGEGLGYLAGRAIPSAYRADDSGRLRVIAPPVGLPELLDAALDPIRLNGRTHPTVMVRLLDGLAGIAARATRPGDRAAVLAHAALIHEQASAAAASEHDRRALAAEFEKVRRAVAESARD
jgi:uncharacterized membrane protein